MPPTAVLSGLMILTGYCTSHATVSVPGTEWEEPILVWISVGLYDELSSFLTQINLYKGRGLSDSHDLSLFLQLYNRHPWARKTGMHTLRVVTTVLNLKCKDSISLHFKTGQTPQSFNSCLMSELL